MMTGFSADNASMLRGSISTDRVQFGLGQPIWVTLELHNESAVNMYVFVPTGRAQGFRFEIRGGQPGTDYELTGLESEPEPGLVGETRIEPGGSFQQLYPLTQWVTFKRPGTYVAECEIDIEVHMQSLREQSPGLPSSTTTIASKVPLTIVSSVEAGGR